MVTLRVAPFLQCELNWLGTHRQDEFALLECELDVVEVRVLPPQVDVRVDLRLYRGVGGAVTPQVPLPLQQGQQARTVSVKAAGGRGC